MLLVKLVLAVLLLVVGIATVVRLWGWMVYRMKLELMSGAISVLQKKGTKQGFNITSHILVHYEIKLDIKLFLS